MAPAGLARQLEDAYLDAVRETVTAMEGWAGYGMRGHHGDGQRATRVPGTGLLGWMTVHRTARPVAGAPPDPHLHAHLTLLNLVRGLDGQWSAVGAGGRDIHRHAHAADAYVKARLRHATAQRFGIVWERDPRTAEWEVTAVPAQLRQVFSKRSDQVETTLRELGIVTKATTRQSKLAAWQSRQAKHRPGTTAGGGDLRDAWRTQAHAAGVDPTTLVAAATPGPGGPPAASPSPGEVARWVFRPEHGLTAHGKVTTRADVLAAVIDALPGGLTDLAEAEQLVDQVLALDHLVVALPAAGAAHLTNHQRYTTTDILAAEHTVLDAARAGYGTGAAVVDAPVLALAMAEFEAANGFTLTAEQRAVLVRLARGGHAVDTVVGVAGSGKTTIMAALRVAYEAAGLTVAGAATAAVAVQNLQTEAGITSQTIASWLARIRAGEGLAGVGVLVVDEAAMVDDRHLAQLLSAARAAGTKVVGIGDPLQLRAVGVGGTFAAVHTMIGGAWLTENRRQRDVDERAALALWRADERRAALHRWADAGRIHVTDTAAAAHAAMLTVWDHERRQWADPHERIGQLLMLAHTNADVDALNTAAQALRAAASELSGARSTYRLDDGRRVELGAGDAVLLRVNDRRTRRGGTDVLNGFRGIVTAIDGAGRVQVEWRQPGSDGPTLVREWVTPTYVAAGGLSLGYAITAAKAQGLTAARALVYGGGMDAHVLYPAMSRDRWRADLWLAQTLIEDPTDAARHGPAATHAEALARTVAAYAAALERDLPDRLVLTELGRHPDPITPPTPTAPAPAEPATGVGRLREQAERAARDADEVAARVAAAGWRSRRFGDVPDRDLAARIGEADQVAARAAAHAATQAQRAAQAHADAQAGRGPQVRQLTERVDQLRAAVAAGEQAHALRERIHADEQAARAARAELRELDAQYRRSPLALRLAGTSRTEIAARQQQLRTAVRAAEDRAVTARTGLWEAQRAAGVPGQAAAELATLRATWATQLDQARAGDVDAAEAAQRQAQRAAQHARSWQQRAAGLRVEATTRAALDPVVATAQARDRDQAQRAQAARRAAEVRDTHRAYDRVRDADRGPELGR